MDEFYEVDASSANKELADELALIASYYKIREPKHIDKNDQFRVNVYARASEAIANYDKEITTLEDIAGISGIGKSIQQDIKEYLENGKITRLQKLEKQFGKEKQILDEFMSYYGIGPAFALGLYNKGYNSIAEVFFNGELNSAQELGLIWHDDINERIPREEMEMINDHISELLKDTNIQWKMAGSYRRKEPYSNDIDILIKGTRGVDMQQVLSALNTILVAELASGEKFYRGILQLPNTNDDNNNAQFAGHRLDIRLIPEEYFVFALMHFTGSRRFNILIRRRAHEFGLSLSEYGFEILPPTKKRGLKVQQRKFVEIPTVETERDIFNALRVKYLKPEQRTRTLEELEFY